MAQKTGGQLEETALIRAAQAGDRAAFEQLVHAYDQSVLRLAMNLLRSPEDARDVYQEAFLRVYKNLDKFRFDCSFHTWLYRIVTNLCLDHMRKRKVRKEEPTIVATAEGPMDRMDAVQEERAGGDPQRFLFSSELRKRVKEVLAGINAARTNGVRTKALSRIASAAHRGNFGDDRRSGEKLPVPGDAKNEGCFGRFCMSDCGAIKDLFTLYLYGELSFDEEERVEAHLDTCVDCGKALERQREVQVALDNIGIEPAPALLRTCREELRMRLAEEGQAKHGWWERFTDLLTGGSSHSGWLRPAGALTLLALGFGAARVIPQDAFGGALQMGMTEPSASRVRYVEPSSNGKVQIVLDETRQRIISGALNDQKIRVLLLSAAKDPSDPGLRAETVDILNTSAQSADVRDALVLALLHDQNAGVRFKAMEGLKSFAQQSDVRLALTQVLMHDTNPGLRTQAIDLLTKGLNQDGAAPSYDRQVIGAMQELMQRENNSYVRQRCKAALEAVKASTETF